MFKLNTSVTDKATGIKGRLTHKHVSLSGNESYIFQPKGLNPETLQPLKPEYIAASRIDGGTLEEDLMPRQILGTEVEDEASGFKGMAIGLTEHTNGCVHVLVQPKGTIPKTGEMIDPADFDIRRLKGKAIPKMTQKAKDESRRTTPSPAGLPMGRPPQ